jgi:hypothetical protein
LKGFIFWDISPCSPLKVTTFRRNISSPSPGSNKPSKIPVWEQVASRVDWKSTGIWEDGAGMSLRRHLTLNGLHGVISHHNSRCENGKSYKDPSAERAACCSYFNCWRGIQNAQYPFVSIKFGIGAGSNTVP